MTEKLNAASIERRAEAVKAALVDTGLVSAQMFDEIPSLAAVLGLPPDWYEYR